MSTVMFEVSLTMVGMSSAMVDLSPVKVEFLSVKNALS